MFKQRRWGDNPAAESTFARSVILTILLLSASALAIGVLL